MTPIRSPRRIPKQVIQTFTNQLLRIYASAPLEKDRTNAEAHLTAVLIIAERMGWFSLANDIKGRLKLPKVVRVPIKGYLVARNPSDSECATTRLDET